VENNLYYEIIILNGDFYYYSIIQLFNYLYIKYKKKKKKKKKKENKNFLLICKSFEFLYNYSTF